MLKTSVVYQPVAKGSVTQANMKISATGTNDFVDLTSTNARSQTPTATLTGFTAGISNVASYYFITNVSADLSGYTGYTADIVDSSGKVKRVLLGAAGAGEASSELLTNGDMEAESTWTAFSTGTISRSNTYAHAGTYSYKNISAGGAYGGIKQVISQPAGALLSMSGYALKHDGAATNFRLATLTAGQVASAVAGSVLFVNDTWVEISAYKTLPVAAAYAAIFEMNGIAGTYYYDDVSFKLITAPAATGVWYTGISEDSGWNPNSATFTVRLYSPNPLPSFKGHLLKVKDSTGRAIQGFIKAAGSGAGTFDVDVLDDPGFADTSKWTKDPGGWSVAGGKGVVSKVAGAGIVISQTKNMTIGGLYRAKYDIDAITLGSSYPYQPNAATLFGGTSNTTTGTKTTYKTITANGTIGIYASAANTDLTVDNYNVQQQTAPASTGVTIAATKALAGTAAGAEAWAQKDASFNYNDSSGYTYEIYKVLDAPVVASGSITAGNALMDTTTANAFAAPVGVDLTAYQTGNYILALYNTTGGYAATGWISASAPGGVTLEAELVDGWTNNTNHPYETFTAGAGSAITQAVNTAAGTAVGVCYKAVTASAGALYKEVATITLASGANPYFYWSSSSDTGTPQILFGQGTTTGTYKTAAAAYTHALWYAGENTDFELSGFSLKRVTDVAATGALLLSTKAGSRGYLYKHASFDPNGAMTYKVLYVGD